MAVSLYQFFRPQVFFYILTLTALLVTDKGFSIARRSSGLDSHIRNLNEQVERLEHELSNNELETKVLQQKYSMLEEIVESLKKEIDKSSTNQQTKLKRSRDSFQSKFSSQEGAMKGFASDLKELKCHSNQSTDILKQQSNKIAELESIISQQDNKIEQLTHLLKTLMSALDDSDKNTEDYTVYKVKFGDSLGLIAQKHGVKVNTIKKLNTLKSDTIFSGQKLKIPNKAK